MARNDVRAAAFSSNGTCLLQSESGFSPDLVLFRSNLPKSYMLKCRAVDIDDEGICS
jgi:hypothetical protein